MTSDSHDYYDIGELHQLLVSCCSGFTGALSCWVVLCLVVCWVTVFRELCFIDYYFDIGPRSALRSHSKFFELYHGLGRSER